MTGTRRQPRHSTAPRQNRSTRAGMRGSHNTSEPKVIGLVGDLKQQSRLSRVHANAPINCQTDRDLLHSTSQDQLCHLRPPNTNAMPREDAEQQPPAIRGSHSFN